MIYKKQYIKYILLAILLYGPIICPKVHAQSTPPFGPSDPSELPECGDYQWPLVQSPCPEVQIKQKHDHTPLKQYRANGWDTVVTCATRTLTLSCMPYLPVEKFNGQYTVDTIPYNPPDPTFAQGTKMPVTTDDDFAAEPTSIPFSFFFFGLQKNAFVLGANGMITFDTTAAGRYCPWKFNSKLPWPDSTNKAPASLDCTKNNMRDAIYGIYEDTHPIASYLSGDQGIYYGIQDEEPCRKIICSWNGIPTFPGSRNKNNRCTYQIVCYEGSNIIEVHIKRRGVNTLWQSGHGLIGIQNANGNAQVTGEWNEPTSLVRKGSPAAFYPENANYLTDSLEYIAFRFTPHGSTNYKAHWYRIFDDGSDSVELPLITETTTDPNGYFTPMGYTMGTCPTLTTAVVSPTETSRYVFHLKFRNAANYWYNLYDTITIGIDTSRDLTIRPTNGTAADHQMDICAGNNAQVMVEFPELQDTNQVIVTIRRTKNGTTTTLPDSLFTMGQMYTHPQTSMKRIPALFKPDATSQNTQPGEIDSVYIHLSVDFKSGCHNTAELLVRTLPTYDTVEKHGICQGETFTWEVDGNTYTKTTTEPKAVLQSVGGCDSVVHLDLNVSDNSYFIDQHRDCKPITWLNGKTYSQNNDATAATDTVILKNQWGCDSVVQLDFQIRPMTPMIDADLNFFDYEHLDVTLTDISTGGDSRRWILPNSSDKTDPVVYYTIPYELDSARIMLIESSTFGCTDTATLTIPFRRDVIWFPNVFTPTADNNNRFGSRSRHLLKQKTYIYNRFGELVFECDEIDCQWDGTDLSGKMCQQGSYIYLVRYITEYDPHTTHTMKGNVTILN